MYFKGVIFREYKILLKFNYKSKNNFIKRWIKDVNGYVSK